MASLYLTNVTSRPPAEDFTPAITTTGRWVALLIDTVKGKALIVAADDAIADPGVTKLLTGTSLANLRSKAKATNPTAPQRTAMQTWLVNNGYQPLDAGAGSWWECVHAIARQGNPAADLDLAG